ncbi:MAG TPA: hypothetical protein VH519_14735 [Hyphomicrobiaceae bacterium]
MAAITMMRALPAHKPESDPSGLGQGAAAPAPGSSNVLAHPFLPDQRASMEAWSMAGEPG